ncbi:MAG: serine/threonine protein kinase [Polyangiaceae bacterium]|nr:serine/threonine protein kinase [Polyangiaceae bacterium]
MASLPHELRIGSVIGGKYRIEVLLGEGGHGCVFGATHVELRERRAIKCLTGTDSRDAAAVARFLHEARAAGALRSEHAVRIHDLGRFDTGEPYVVMEWLEGRDLRAVLCERGRIGVAEAADYLGQALEAIEEAHARGIVHRDLKPENLFLTTGVRGNPVIKVLDFGIAKVTGSATVQTADAAVFGTPLYMPPEQIRSTRDVDARADLWALGVVLYELATGEPPFRGANLLEICAAILNDPPPRPSARCPELPAALDAVVARCLAKDRDLRFATATELHAALDPLRGMPPPPAGATRPPAAPPSGAPAETLAAAAATRDPRPAGAVAEATLASPVAPVVPRRRPARVVAVVGLGLVGAVSVAAVVLATTGNGAAPHAPSGSTTPSAPRDVPAEAATATSATATSASASASAKDKYRKIDFVRLAQSSGRPVRPAGWQPKVKDKVLAGWRSHTRGEWDAVVVTRIEGDRYVCAYEDARGEAARGLPLEDLLPRPSDKDAELPAVGSFVIAKVSPSEWEYARVRRVERSNVYVEYVPGMGWDPTELEEVMVRPGELVLVK